MRKMQAVKNFIHIFRPLYSPLFSFVRKRCNISSPFYCFVKFIRRLPSSDFRRYLSQYLAPESRGASISHNHPLVNMPVHVLGPLNKGRVIMLLENQSHHGGFCALWVYFLNRLSFSDKMGFYHVIDWNESEFYQEEHPVNGSTSIFGYYFQQPSGISLAEAKRSKSVVYDWNNPEFGYDDVFHVGGNMDYKFTSDDIKQFAAIQRKYIHLHPFIEKSFNEQISSLFQGKKTILGVHARGADTKIGYKDHPTIITSEDYIDKTEQLANQINADLIFLATDDQEILDQFKKKFGDKLVYYDDVIRSNGTVMNCFIEDERENHHYLLGLEIIRDVYTLAACTGFVCGMSYVSFIVQILKKAKNQKFKVFFRIFKGLAKEGIELTDPNVRKKVKEKWDKELKYANNSKVTDSQNIEKDIKENEKK